MDEPKFMSFNNPATGESFGQVEMATPEEAQAALIAMRASAKTWASISPRERARILGNLQQVMLDSLDEITAVINQDTGKNRQDALAEVMMTVELLARYRAHAPRWLRRRRVSSSLFIFKTSYVEPRPYGVTLVISPWNYPFYLAMPPVLAALLAGNTVILKPSEITAATGVIMESLFSRVPELTPFVRVLHGDGVVGAALVQAQPDYIFLTGSPQTGKKVMQTAAEHLIPVACELGGKDAVIVLEDADVASAARWIVWGAFYNTGQTCISVERVYVVETVYNEFVRLALEETRRLKAGYTSNAESPFYIGSMTDPRQVKIIERHLDDALAKGARLLTGGKRQGMFFEPIVLVDVDHEMALMCEETFGPILPIMVVKDEVEAIRLANDSEYGLGASVWSNNLKRAVRVARQIEAGSILVNDVVVQITIPMVPFGGMKKSGYGRIHGKEGLLQFTQTLSYVVSRVPNPVDLTVIFRKPGHYWFGVGLWRLLFGMNLRQRWEGLKALLRGRGRTHQGSLGAGEQGQAFQPDPSPEGRGG